MDSVLLKFGELNAVDCTIWLVRVLLPVLLFWIWYRTQALKEPEGNSYSRQDVLAARLPTEPEDAPEGLRGIRLVADVQVQKVLGLPAARPGAVVRRDSGGKGAGKRSTQPRRSTDSLGSGVTPTTSTASAAVSAALAAERERQKATTLTEEERSQIEALLNFVAFGFKEQPKRIFLPEEHRPPPPPKKPAAPAGRRIEADALEAATANSEAQSVLKGLANSKAALHSADVAPLLQRRLDAAGVALSEATYALMVQSCVSANDLRSASDFLMKMESAGHSADHDLLDKVMDLYSASRCQGSASPAASPLLLRTGGLRGGGGGPSDDEAPGASLFGSGLRPTAAAAHVGRGGGRSSTARHGDAYSAGGGDGGWGGGWSEDEDKDCGD